VKCFVRGVAVPKGSKKAFIAGGRPIIVDDNRKALKDWASAVSGALQSDWEGPPLEGPVAVTLTFWFLKPPSARKRAYPVVKPDLDKIARAVLDAMTGIAFRDDAQVVRLMLSKDYNAESGVHVSVGPVLEADHA